MRIKRTLTIASVKHILIVSLKSVTIRLRGGAEIWTQHHSLFSLSVRRQSCGMDHSVFGCKGTLIHFLSRGRMPTSFPARRRVEHSTDKGRQADVLKTTETEPRLDDQA